MDQPIDFYFEFASPYGYLASTRIDALAAKHGRRAVWRPMMLGAAFKQTGARPLMEIPLKSTYLVHDVARFARLWQVPFAMPAVMPMRSLAASRAFYWLADQQGEAQAQAFARAVFHAHFGEGRDLGSAEAVAAVAGPLGVERDALLHALEAPALKARLRAETDAAIARGVFGSPFIFIGEEPFWGADRLDQIERWLASGGW